MTGLRVTILCLLIGLSGALRASRTFPVGWVAVADTSETVVVKDSVVAQSDTPTAEVAEPVDTARLIAFTDSVAKQVPPLRRTANFVPNPKRALWLSRLSAAVGFMESIRPEKRSMRRLSVIFRPCFLPSWPRV